MLFIPPHQFYTFSILDEFDKLENTREIRTRTLMMVKLTKIDVVIRNDASA